jgi:hypothetical protein
LGESECTRAAHGLEVHGGKVQDDPGALCSQHESHLSGQTQIPLCTVATRHAILPSASSLWLPAPPSCSPTSRLRMLQLTAACELFARHVTRTALDIGDFDACKIRLIERGERFAEQVESRQAHTDTHTHTHTRTHIHTYIHTYIHTHTQTHIYKLTYKNKHRNKRTHARLRIRSQTRIYVNIYIEIQRLHPNLRWLTVSDALASRNGSPCTHTCATARKSRSPFP